MDETLELRIRETNQFTVRTGVECDLFVFPERLRDEYVHAIEIAKWWHGALLLCAAATSSGRIGRTKPYLAYAR